MQVLKERGIGCAPYFPAIHLQPLYRERFGYAPGDFPTCESVASRTLALPFYPGLSASAIDHVAGALRELLPELRTT
jgi:perosamine synthetase